MPEQNVLVVTRRAARRRPLHPRGTVNVVDHGGNAGPRAEARSEVLLERMAAEALAEDDAGETEEITGYDFMSG
jgi:hypothetical protein